MKHVVKIYCYDDLHLYFRILAFIRADSVFVLFNQTLEQTFLLLVILADAPERILINSSIHQKATKKSNRKKMDDVAGTQSDYLLELRREGFKKYQNNGWGTTNRSMLEVISMQSAFPVKIREEIRVASNSGKLTCDPKAFFKKVEGAVASLLFFRPRNLRRRNEEENEVLQLLRFARARRSPRRFGFVDEIQNNDEVRWDGLDCETDTEEEVEIALRMFPVVLRHIKIAWVPHSLKALSFVPLVTNLNFEYNKTWQFQKSLSYFPPSNIPLYEITKTCARRNFLPRVDNEDFDKEVDEVSHLILSRLYESFSTKKKDEIGYYLSFCIREVFHAKPCRSEKTLRMLLDWHPDILRSQRMMEFYLWESSRKGERWMRFQTLFDAGMSNYAKDLGFLFHFKTKDLVAGEILFISQPERNSFQRACCEFGSERVTNYVEKIVLKMTRGRAYAHRALLLSAICNPCIDADGVHFLLRLDPMALIPTRS